MQKQLDDLKMRIKCLENENIRLICAAKMRDSVLYCDMRNEIFDAFSNISRLDFDFKSTSEKIAVTGLFTKLMQASNPSSDILGFRFSEIIFSAAEKYFLPELRNENDKRRFSQVIGKIISNPVVNSLANLNPVSSVVSSIVSTIAGFSTSRVDLDKEGGKIKDVHVSQQDAFDDRSVAAFRNDLQVYIDFYDAMIATSEEYLECVGEMNIKYNFLMEKILTYEEKLIGKLDLQKSSLLICISNLMPDPSLNNLNYSTLVIDDRIRESYELASHYPALHSEVNAFIRDYQLILKKFLDDYIKILQMALNFPEKDIDKVKTRVLITDIETFIDQQIILP